MCCRCIADLDEDEYNGFLVMKPHADRFLSNTCWYDEFGGPEQFLVDCMKAEQMSDIIWLNKVCADVRRACLILTCLRGCCADSQPAMIHPRFDRKNKQVV